MASSSSWVFAPIWKPWTQTLQSRWYRRSWSPVMLAPYMVPTSLWGPFRPLSGLPQQWPHCLVPVSALTALFHHSDKILDRNNAQIETWSQNKCCLLYIASSSGELLAEAPSHIVNHQETDDRDRRKAELKLIQGPAPHSLPMNLTL